MKNCDLMDEGWFGEVQATGLAGMRAGPDLVVASMAANDTTVLQISNQPKKG